MKIKLITPARHAELTKLAADHPELVFDNVGYQYLRAAIREDKALPIARIEEILKEHVIGFSRFFNFRRRVDGGLALRFDYNWGAEDASRYFIGVGYLLLDHLRDGFPEEAAQC